MHFIYAHLLFRCTFIVWQIAEIAGEKIQNVPFGPMTFCRTGRLGEKYLSKQPKAFKWIVSVYAVLQFPFLNLKRFNRNFSNRFSIKEPQNTAKN